ncbi:MAG: hemolysin family protein, partial [Nitriliruptor sp.]
ELFPKNLAISRPLPVAMAVTPFTRAFGIALRPIILVFDRAAEWLTRRVFRVEVPSELESGHSLEELARIIDASGQEGEFTRLQTQLLRRAVELGNSRAGEVMVPRPDVVWLREDDTLEELRRVAAATGHSRFPVRGTDDDDVRGTVHVKDLMLVPASDHAATAVASVLQPPLVVPESQQLHELLSALRRERRTFAVVIDEFGGTAGVVTTEDVLELLVGDIEDEFDDSHHTIRRLGAGRYVVDGTLRTERLAELTGLEVPDGAYETVAGLVLDRLGHIPEPGEVVTEGRLELQVTRIDGVRVTALTVTVRPEDDVEVGR